MLPEPAAPEGPDRAACERVARLLVDRVGVAPPSPSTDLFESGLLDSLGMIDMLAALEQEFDLRIDLEDLDLDSFRSVEAVAAFVSRRRPRERVPGASRARLVDVSDPGGSGVPP